MRDRRVTVSRNRLIAVIGGLIAVIALFGACTEPNNSDGNGGREREASSVNAGFDRLTQSQQVPQFDFSQERQTLIDVLSARANGTHGTAFATSMGGDLLWWCPTIGTPIPSTYQLSNPDQIIGGDGERTEEQVIPLGEPSGVYTGDSAATWTLCLDNAGTPFAVYEEANVGWRSGIVNDLPADKRAQVDEITFDFTTEDAE